MAEASAKIVLEGVDKASPVIRKLHKQILAATKDIRAKNKAVAESFRSLGGSIRTVALAAAAAGGGLFALVKSTTNAGDQFLKASQKAGVSIEGLQRLTFAAKLADVSQEQLGTSLKFLNKNLVDARKGSKELTAAFKVLKLDPKKLGDTEEAFIKIGGAIGALKDQQQKAAIALDIFGRSGTDLIPLFNEGEKAIREYGERLKRMGGIIGPEMAQRFQTFNDNITTLLEEFIILKRVIGNQLFPVFEDIVQSTLKWVDANRELIGLKVKEFAQDLLEFFRWIKANGPKILETFRGLVDALGGVTKIVKTLGVIWAAVIGVKFLKAAYSLFALVGTIGKAFLGVAGVISGPVAAAVAALAAIIGSVFLVVKRKEATAWLKDMGLGFLVDGSIIKLMEPIGQHFAKVWRSAGQDIEAIKGVAVAVFNAIGTHLSTVFVAPLATVKNLFVEAFNGIRGAARSLVTDLASSLQNLNPNTFLLRKIGIPLPSVGGVQRQTPGPTSSAPPASIPAPVSAGQQGQGRELWARLSALTQEISGQQQTLKKPQNIDLRIKVDSPVPTQVASVSSSPGLNISARTGQMIP